MPKVNEMYPSKFLKAADCEDEDMVLTIKGIKQERLGSDDKWILMFREDDRGLVLNKTNTKTITKLYGDDTDDWVGNLITLFATEVDFQGELVPSIRVRTKVPKKSTGKQPTAARPQTEDDGDGDVPF